MNIFSILLILTSLYIAVLAIHSFRFRKSEIGLYFFLLLAAMALFSFCYAFEIGSFRISYKLFWLRAGYVGLASIPPLLMLFTLSFTGKSKYITNWLLGVMLILVFVILLSNYTNDFHHLYYTEIWKKDLNIFSILVLIRGPLYWPFIAYTTVFSILSMIMISNVIIKKRGPYRAQAVLILLSTLPTWVINTLYVLRESPYGVDFSAFGFLFSAAFMSIALFNYHMLGFIPIALENVFKSMHDGVILIDNEDRMVNYNNSASGMFTINNDMIGTDINKILKMYQNLVGKIESKDNDVFFFSIKEEVGDERFIQARVMPISDKRDVKIGSAIMLYDITEQTVSQNKLRESNETKDKLFSIVSHDLRGPLGNMMNLISLICEQYENMEKDDLGEILAALNGQTQSTYRLIENLLFWSKSQLGQIVKILETLPVRSIVNDVVEIMAPSLSAKSLTINIEVDEKINVYADVEMLKIVLRNLIGNSLKYCNTEGEITVIATSNGVITCLSVKDNGIGMDEQTLSGLFKWTSQRSMPGTNREPGSRLGLVLCKEFIEKLNGTISAESIKGEGSCFTITLPASSQEHLS